MISERSGLPARSIYWHFTARRKFLEVRGVAVESARRAYSVRRSG